MMQWDQVAVGEMAVVRKMSDAGSEMGQDVAANRELWTQVNAEYTEEHAIRAWAAEDITWGIFNLPEHALGVLGTVSGCDVVELGCGTAYFSAWLARRGARPVGVDVTPAQLATERRCQNQFGIWFPLIEAPSLTPTTNSQPPSGPRDGQSRRCG